MRAQDHTARRRRFLQPLTFLGLAFAASPASAQTLADAVAAAEAGGFRGQVIAADRSTVTFNSVTGAAPAPPAWVWGSVSKQVTAVLTMVEVQEGRLSLDDSILRWLPDFPNPATGQATVRDLLRHTSGLYNPEGAAAGDALPTFYARQDRHVGGTADAMNVCGGAAASELGAFSYNNCDTIVLGAILERVTRRSFASLLRSRLTRPLGLASVRLARSGERLSVAPDRRVNVATYGPAGAIIGSAEDLVRFNQALLAGRILSPASLATMWSGEPRLGYVALGAWEFQAPLRDCAAPVRLVERRGSVAGVQARNIIAPDLGKILTVFTPVPSFDFGEIWRGSGASFELASAAFCTR